MIICKNIGSKSYKEFLACNSLNLDAIHRLIKCTYFATVSMLNKSRSKKDAALYQFNY